MFVYTSFYQNKKYLKTYFLEHEHKHTHQMTEYNAAVSAVKWQQRKTEKSQAITTTSKYIEYFEKFNPEKIYSNT